MPTASTHIAERDSLMTVTTPQAGFAELFDRHHEAVFRAALRITGNAADAEDILQTVFLRVLTRGAEIEGVTLPAKRAFGTMVEVLEDEPMVIELSPRSLSNSVCVFTEPLLTLNAM